MYYYDPFIVLIHVTYPIYCAGESCTDTDNGAADPYGDVCDDYNDYPNWCGGYDDDDFVSEEMCCICGGGGSAGVTNILLRYSHVSKSKLCILLHLLH